MDDRERCMNMAVGMVVGIFNFAREANSQMETHYETQHETRL